MSRKACQRARGGKRFAVALVEAGTADEIVHVREWSLPARRRHAFAAGLREAFDETQAEAEGE